MENAVTFVIICALFATVECGILCILGWTLEATRLTTLGRREGWRERDIGSPLVWGSLVTWWDVQEAVSTGVKSTELHRIISTQHQIGAHSKSSLRVSVLAQQQDNSVHAQNSFPSALTGIFYGRRF